MDIGGKKWRVQGKKTGIYQLGFEINPDTFPTYWV